MRKGSAIEDAFRGNACLSIGSRNFGVVDPVRGRPADEADARFRPREPGRKPAPPPVRSVKWIPCRKSRSMHRPRSRWARRGFSRTIAGGGSPRGAGHGGRRSGHTARSPCVTRGSAESHCRHFSRADTRMVRVEEYVRWVSRFVAALCRFRSNEKMPEKTLSATGSPF